jgi:polyisoprenoid-binding protein YceI
MKALAKLSLLILCIPLNALAKLDFYSIDPVHTRVAFRIMHAGLSPSIGTVSAPTGHIWFDDQDIAKSSVEIQMPVNRLDMGDLEWTNKVLSSTYLSSEKYPIATFTSTSIQVDQDNKFWVDGTLCVSGECIPIRFNVILNAHKRHPLTLRNTIGLQATTQFSRAALGVTAWPSIIDDTVYMDVTIEAIKSTPPKLEQPQDAH